MAYSDDYAIIGGATQSFDCETTTGWTPGGTAVTGADFITNSDNRGGTASVEMRGTAGLATWFQNVGTADVDRFKIQEGTLNVWFRYSKGKGASYLGDGSTVVIRLYFGGTTDFADYRPLDNADEDLDFGWNLLQISGRTLNGGSINFVDNDTNWDRFIHRVEMRLNLQNANDKASEDAPILMDSWFFGTKIIVSEGTPGVPVSIEDVETYSNDDTATHGGDAFPLGLVDVDDVFVNLRCGIDVGNGSDGANNEGNLVIGSKFLLFNQWSPQAKQPLTVTNFSTLQYGAVDAGADGNYPVRGCQIVMPPGRPNDITVESGGTLKLFNSKIFRFRDIFLDSGSIVELRGVAIDSCNIVYFDAATLDLQDIEIYNNTGGAQCAEMTVSPDSCSNFLVHDCAQGMHFRATLTMEEYLAQDNIGNDFAVLDGSAVTLVSSFFDKTKIGRLTS